MIPIPGTGLPSLTPEELLRLPTAAEKAAMTGSNEPSSGNPYATLADVAGLPEGTKMVLVNAAQSFTDPEKAQGRANLGVVAATATVAGIVKKLTGPGIAPDGTAVDGSDYRLPVDIRQFGASIADADATAAIQAAIDYAAANGRILVSGPETYNITSIKIPGGLSWHSVGTGLKQIAGTNLPLIENLNQNPSGYTDKNITISGRLYLDQDGANQANAMADGSVNMAARFMGVDGLSLRIDILNQRRFGAVFANCINWNIQGAGTWNPAIGSLNTDGVHIYGNCHFFKVDWHGINLVDDTISITQVDGAAERGGVWTVANTQGPVSNGILVSRNTNTYQGLRLLSSTHAIRNIKATVMGDVCSYGLTASSYGMTDGNALFQGIEVDLDCIYNPAPPPDLVFRLVDIVTTNNTTNQSSDFKIRINHVSGGTDAYFRETVRLITLPGDVVDIEKIHTDGTNGVAIINAVQCLGGTVRVNGIRRLNSALSVGGVDSTLFNADNSVLDHVEIGPLEAVDKLRTVYLGYRDNVSFTSQTKELIAYCPPAGVITGALNPFYAGDYHTVLRSEITGPNTPTQYGERWGFSGVGGPSVSLDRPAYLATAPAARPPNPVLGDSCFDVTLGIPISWNGSVWKNSSGATV